MFDQNGVLDALEESIAHRDTCLASLRWCRFHNIRIPPGSSEAIQLQVASSESSGTPEEELLAEEIANILGELEELPAAPTPTDEPHETFFDAPEATET